MRVRPVEQNFLDAYDPSAYTPFAVAVDVVALTIRDKDLCALMVKRAEPPFEGQWALPGTFVQPDEKAEDAALRALQTKTGFDAHIEQLRTYTAPDRDPRMRVVSVAYLTFGVMDSHISIPGAEWWPVSKMGVDFGGRIDRRTLAFDHQNILWDGVERARSKIEYTTLATRFLSSEFTLDELRKVYEVVWAREVHDANFRRKVRATENFAVPLDDKRISSKSGPRPHLYTAGKATYLYPPIRREQGWW